MVCFPLFFYYEQRTDKERMTKEEYFGDWLKVLPEAEMTDILKKLGSIKDRICPEFKDVFKAFNKCPYKDLRLVIVGQD